MWVPEKLELAAKPADVLLGLLTPCCWVFRPIVFHFSEKTDEDMRRYKYNGVDLSFIYAYLLSPLASALAEYFPRWVAPNLITLVALMCPVSAVLLCAYHCESFNCQDAPRYPFAFIAICILVYQTLDNIDGKQARRTGSSSALGLFFDHGCDAMCASLSSMTLTCMLIGSHMDSSIMFFVLTTAFTCFFFGGWEHHLQGRFVLPIINGPNEGLWLAACLAMTSYFNGSEWWWQPGENGWTPFDYVRIGSYTGQLYTAATHVTQTLHWLYKKSGSVHLCISALMGLFPLAYLITLGWLWSYMTPDFIRVYPHVVLILCGCVHFESCTSLMYCHMTHMPYSGLHFTMLPLAVGTANAVFGLGLSVVSLHGLVVLSAVYVLGCYIYAIFRIARGLGISAFRIKSSPDASGQLKKA